MWIGARIHRYVHRELGAFLERRRALRAAQHSTAASLRLLEFYGRPVVKEHIAALRDDDAKKLSSAAILSYPTSRAIGLISPRFLGPEKGPTVMCTVAIGEQYRDRVQPCLQSQIDFATRHGFSFCILEEAPQHIDRTPHWMKILLIAKLLLHGYSRILFIDADAMIANKDVDVDQLFLRLEHNGQAILLTEDEAGINVGVIFVRNMQAALRVLDLIWLNDTDVHHALPEQNALKVLMDSSKEVSSVILVEDNPKAFNSFPVERSLFHPTRPRQVWSHGDFICHFSGIRSPYLERYVADYAESLRWNSAGQQSPVVRTHESE